tara:strand:+ start:120 stop:431 length:312 start_codon:yes stop_codon:yes gene_type:complete
MIRRAMSDRARGCGGTFRFAGGLRICENGRRWCSAGAPPPSVSTLDHQGDWRGDGQRAACAELRRQRQEVRFTPTTLPPGHALREVFDATKNTVPCSSKPAMY